MYIISSKERSVFLQLETDSERSIFIEAFWKQGKYEEVAFEFENGSNRLKENKCF